ncbi:hypothetical protein AO726_10650 [Pseudomonas sp. TTU2014-080ASC]|nr:hypothetical protein AO726_10650 [Pseudomonas sp. TTU2014-080ASC]
MGQAHRVSSVWWTALGLIAVGLGLAFIVPEEVPGVAFAIAIAFGMHELSKFYMQEYLRLHMEREGAFVSNWWAVPVGICGILLQLAVIGALVLLDI